MLKKVITSILFAVITTSCFYNILLYADTEDSFIKAYSEMEKAVFNKSSFVYTEETINGGMIEFKNGVIGGKIDDFDNDSKKELLVFNIEHGGKPLDTEDMYGRQKETGKVTAEIYEEENGKIIKTDSFSVSEFLNSDAGEYEFFIKEENGIKYIAVQNISYSSCFADGLIFDTQIYMYNGEKFENKLSMFGGGSSFDFSTYYAKEIKELRDLGFSKAVNQMLDGYTIVNLTNYDSNIEKIIEAYANTNITDLGEIYGYSELDKIAIEHGIVNVTLNNYTSIDGISNMYKPISIILNGNELNFEQPPYIDNGTTMVPMRAIFEELEAKVSFDVKTKTITSEKDGKIITLRLDSDIAYIDSKPIKLNTKVKSLNGYSMVPLRFISETFGAKLDYNGIDKIINITT